MKKLLLSILILTTITPCYSKTWEASFKSAVGFAAGAATGVGTAEGLKYTFQDPYYSQYSAFSLGDQPKLNAAIYTASFFLGGYIGKKIGYYCTPDSRFKRAKKLVQSIDTKLLDICSYGCQNVGMCYVYDADKFYYGIKTWYAHSKFPLRSAFENLIQQQYKLTKAKSLLESTREKATFTKASDRLLDVIYNARMIILEASMALKECPNWIEESLAYEAEQARLAQERIARAQEDQARAQHSLATATWINALQSKKQNNIYIDNHNYNN
ncbi:hypothetical protein A3F06_03435 [candidate division TM6 bacterium RIFCSPHIGHO2_12_FULL_36_22]|nr:MAG: hypothetical protein A3F06_03435 [candidate division TM6 bacterium RIFCSPHIGHO2_12_FULL_36_22]